MLITSCTSLNNNSITDTENRLNTIVHNPQSMTNSLKKLDHNFKVSLIYNGVENANYTRFVALELESTPVIVAISSTKLSNRTFLNILSQAHNNSIGTQLFAKNSKIKRDPNMQINNIIISQIQSKIVYDYLNNIGYKSDQTIIERISSFYYKNEDMQLTEYILPKIKDFL
ncbi:MAG: hypothetical protein LW807_04240 [Proteobacteria bacterium]|jgi:chorismate-pyruvate lyase|nr:hypothetical protein [Pseudomonadota bacterium]